MPERTQQITPHDDAFKLDDTQPTRAHIYTVFVVRRVTFLRRRYKGQKPL